MGLAVTPFIAFAHVAGKSRPFNLGRTVEVKLEIESTASIETHGAEIFLRVPAEHAGDYRIGARCSIHVDPMD
jgi:hypothetical protein